MIGTSWQEVVEESSIRRDVASRNGLESWGLPREGQLEALTGEIGRPAIEPRNHEIRDADVVQTGGRHYGRGR